MMTLTLSMRLSQATLTGHWEGEAFHYSLLQNTCSGHKSHCGGSPSGADDGLGEIAMIVWARDLLLQGADRTVALQGDSGDPGAAAHSREAGAAALGGAAPGVGRGA